MITLPRPLVSAQWLLDNHHTDIVIFDASVPPVVPGFESINGEGIFKAIPGALRFDYDKDICDPNSTLPHMMPDAELFQSKLRALGLNQNSQVVVYDDVGLYASPRAWWMLSAMGHTQVSVLDGGLPAWLAAGGKPADSLADATVVGDFVAKPNSELFYDAQRVLEASADHGYQIIDARSQGRFEGTAPEPRPGMRSGHMPNANNLPFGNVLEGGFLKSPAELKTLFDAVSDSDQHIITSCGSGITACVLTLAAKVAGFNKLTVYDGSWSEWGMPGELPVVTD